MKKEKAIFNWSGGKDSSLTLYKVSQTGEYDILCLLTSVNEQHRRISMHGVRIELLRQQAKSLELPLVEMQITEMATMQDYERVMKATLTGLKQRGAAVSIFGDIFLEDLRRYREKKLAELDLKGVFPIWKIPTSQLVREFIDLGFKSILTCVNEQYLDKSFAGRLIDNDFLKDLPENVDPCGENGEFHTFTFDGPIFKVPIQFELGEKVYRKYTPISEINSSQHDRDNKNVSEPFQYGFWYCDLVPSENIQANKEVK